MKNLILLVVSLFTFLPLIAQKESQHLLFGDILIDGTVDKFAAELLWRDCEYRYEGDDYAVLKGRFGEIDSCYFYVLYPTNNIWTFIKLNTRNGKMTQVQFDIEGNNRFETNLNSESLVYSISDEENGRFALYPTQNTFNFILLDQIDGRTWQVQWSHKRDNRLVIRIY